MAASIPLSKFSFAVILLTIAVCEANFFLSCKKPECVHVDLDALSSQEILVKALDNGDRKLCIFCYPGQRKTWYKLWVRPKITLNLTSPDTAIEVYHGKNVTDVVSESRSSGFLSWSALTFLREEYSFQPFNSSCIGFASTKGYTARFQVKNPDIWLVAYTVIGLLIFFFAPSWSRNIYLQYSTGVSLGILGSIILLVFILNKFMPQKLKTLTYVIAITSTSALLFVIQWLSDYFHDIVTNHWQYLIGYIAVAALLSFAIIYRYGPISDPRTLNLVKWLLQAVGLVLVYHGTQISEMSIAIIIVTLCVYNFPQSLFVRLKKFRYRYFPPKMRLLTEEEFYREAEVETKKALEELRDYCQSPDCNAWRTLSRLTSPNRFASFIEGESHISDAELMDHDRTAERFPAYDDDSDESELSFRMMTR